MTAHAARYCEERLRDEAEKRTEVEKASESKEKLREKKMQGYKNKLDFNIHSQQKERFVLTQAQTFL